MKIGYLTFGRDDFGYGLALCLSQLFGHDLFRVTPKTAKYVDVLLFSCFWWEHIYLLADFLRRAGIKKEDSNRPNIIIGGFNSFNPVPFLSFAASVAFIAMLLPSYFCDFLIFSDNLSLHFLQ